MLYFYSFVRYFLNTIFTNNSGAECMIEGAVICYESNLIFIMDTVFHEEVDYFWMNVLLKTFSRLLFTQMSLELLGLNLSSLMIIATPSPDIREITHTPDHVQ